MLYKNNSSNIAHTLKDFNLMFGFQRYLIVVCYKRKNEAFANLSIIVGSINLPTARKQMINVKRNY